MYVPRRRGVGQGASLEQTISLPWYCYVPGIAMVAPDTCNIFGNQAPAAGFVAPPAPAAPPQSVWTTPPASGAEAQQTVQEVTNAQIAAAQQQAADYAPATDETGALSFWDKWGMWLVFGGLIGGILLDRGGRR